MKTLSLQSALIVPTLFLTAAQAQTPEVPVQSLVQALLDKSESLSKIKHDCTSGVRNTRSEQTEPGVYVHTLTLGRNFRGQPGKDCKVIITQDYRPTYVDGAIAYTVVIEELR